jgi:nitrile hydratase accessory protein
MNGPNPRAAGDDILRAAPGLAADADGPVFAEPWQAQAFALAVSCHGKGLFSWPEWAETLAGEIRRAQQSGDPDHGDSYYRHWLGTLERLLAAKGVTSVETLDRYRHAWDRAAHRTPHGAPIALKPEDFAGQLSE